MTPDVTLVWTPRPFIIDVTFANGVERRIDLTDELHGPMFEPLRDPDYFQRVQVDAETGTVTWPNGADFSPEFLYAARSVELDEPSGRRPG